MCEICVKRDGKHDANSSSQNENSAHANQLHQISWNNFPIRGYKTAFAKLGNWNVFLNSWMRHTGIEILDMIIRNFGCSVPTKNPNNYTPLRVQLIIRSNSFINWTRNERPNLESTRISWIHFEIKWPWTNFPRWGCRIYYNNFRANRFWRINHNFQTNKKLLLIARMFSWLFMTQISRLSSQKSEFFIASIKFILAVKGYLINLIFVSTNIEFVETECKLEGRTGSILWRSPHDKYVLIQQHFPRAYEMTILDMQNVNIFRNQLSANNFNVFSPLHLKC
jgi:hypothetical protein